MDRSPGQEKEIVSSWYPVPIGQGSAILPVSVRNCDTKVPGISIGIEFCTSLGLSISLGIEFIFFWVPHYEKWEISSIFTLYLFQGLGISIEIGIEFCTSLGLEIGIEIVQTFFWYQYRNRY